MSDRKNSVLLYTDDMETLEDLTFEQRGLLLTAILCYQAGADMPEMDKITNMAFKFMKKQIDANNKAYENACEQRKSAAASRWNKGSNDNDKAEPESKKKTTAASKKTKPSAKANEESAELKAQPEDKSEMKSEVQETANTAEAEESEQCPNEENAGENSRIVSHKFASPRILSHSSRISSHSSAYFRNAKNAENDKENEKENEKENDKENENEREKAAYAASNARAMENESCAIPKPKPSTVCEFDQEQLDEIISRWNANKCTQKIDRIATASVRYDNARRCANLYGFEDFLSTIEKTDSNKWFSSRGNPVAFDWYVKPDNYQKVHDGNYKEVFEKPPKPQNAKKNSFFNFNQRGNEVYEQLEKYIYD